MTKNSNHKILNFFKDLLEYNKLSFLKDSRINELIDLHQSFTEFKDLERGIIKFYKPFYDQKTDSSIDGLITFDFYKIFKKELQNESIKIINSLDEIIYLKSENAEPIKPFLDNVNKELHFLYLKAEKLYSDYPEISNALSKVENHLFNRYQIQPFAKKQIDNKLSYFGFKDSLSKQVFQDLYELADKFEIIEFDVVNENTFLEVLLGNPQDKDAVIYFYCKNGLAISFLEKLRPYFTSLTPATIEKSKRFYTKRKLLLTENTYNTTKSRLKDNPSQLQIELIQELDAILKK